MPRHVLFLAWAPFFSGAERALLVTLQALNGTGYVPHVLAGTPGEFVARVSEMGIECQVAGLKPLDRRRPMAGVLSIATVARAAKRSRASLVHSNEAPSFQPGGYAARLLGLPSVTHVRFPNGADGFNWFLRPGFSRALFVSHDLMNTALSQAPALFANRSEVLHDGVELQPAWPPDAVGHCREELGLPQDETVVALVGQVAEVKGIWEFVDAARLLMARGCRALFVVLGDDLKGEGAMRRAMESKVNELGLSSRFRFLGFRPDAPRLVQAFDIIAVPSHVEPLGNATLEAMAAGRPVIGSRVGGIPEMVVDGETGILVPPRDPATLAVAFERLITDVALRARMGESARRRAGEAFGVEAHGRRLAAIYDRLLDANADDSQRSPVDAT
jgi:glycosyltransferase involved in cell wall biosynthesis